MQSVLTFSNIKLEMLEVEILIQLKTIKLIIRIFWTIKLDRCFINTNQKTVQIL